MSLRGVVLLPLFSSICCFSNTNVAFNSVTLPFILNLWLEQLTERGWKTAWRLIAFLLWLLRHNTYNMDSICSMFPKSTMLSVNAKILYTLVVSKQVLGLVLQYHILIWNFYSTVKNGNLVDITSSRWHCWIRLKWAWIMDLILYSICRENSFACARSADVSLTAVLEVATCHKKRLKLYF